MKGSGQNKMLLLNVVMQFFCCTMSQTINYLVLCVPTKCIFRPGVGDRKGEQVNLPFFKDKWSLLGPENWKSLSWSHCSTTSH